jgi:hypothetical protein
MYLKQLIACWLMVHIHGPSSYPPSHCNCHVCNNRVLTLIRFGVVKNTRAHSLQVVGDWLVWPQISAPYQALLSPFICRGRTKTPLYVVL